MKTLCLLFCLVALSCVAAPPPVSISGSREWTNFTGSIFPIGLDPTNGTFILSTNRGALILGHASPFYVGGGGNTAFMVSRDGSKGDPDDAQMIFQSSRDMNADGPTNLFSHVFSGSSSLASGFGGGFVGYQMAYQNQDGLGENFDFSADGDVFSQFIFSRSLPGTLDANPMVMAPNFSGQDITPLTAYKFGTSYAVTNGDLVEFLNGGTLKASIDKNGALTVVGVSSLNGANTFTGTSQFSSGVNISASEHITGLVTNDQNLYFSTNAVTANNIDATLPIQVTNCTANPTISGIVNVPTGKGWQTALYLYANGSDRTVSVTIPNTHLSPGGTLVATNGSFAILTVGGIGASITGAVFRPFP